MRTAAMGKTEPEGRTTGDRPSRIPAPPDDAAAEPHRPARNYGSRERPVTMGRPHLWVAVMRGGIEFAMRSEVVSVGPVSGLPQVHWVRWLVRFLSLLRVEPGSCEITVEQAGGHRVGDQSGCGARSNPVLATLWMLRGVADRAGDELGLEDRRNGLRAARQP